MQTLSPVIGPQSGGQVVAAEAPKLVETPESEFWCG
jgi:hypothetical protein